MALGFFSLALFFFLSVDSDSSGSSSSSNTKKKEANVDRRSNVPSMPALSTGQLKVSPSDAGTPESRCIGFEPVYFITSATPHLGSRGLKQVPLFSGSRTLERLATRMSQCLDLVGWSTSSIRRRSELPKHQCAPVNKKYPHIVNVEAPGTSSNHEEVL